MSNPKRAKFSAKDDDDFINYLKDIEKCQEEMDTLQDKTNTEVIKLEHKLEYEKKPLYTRREESISQIPNFWLTALLNHPDISSLLDDSEEDYLTYLTRIEVQIYEHFSSGFKILFHFKENPYFKNTVLTKVYYQLTEGEKTTNQIAATPILWKEGNDISAELKERKSFFYWLTTNEFGPTDIDIAQVIKDDLWTNPLNYYLLSDNDHDDNSEEDDENDDVLIIEDSDDDEKSTQDEPEDDESENETDDCSIIE